MRKEDFDTFINGVGNDLKIAIDCNLQIGVYYQVKIVWTLKNIFNKIIIN